MVLLPLVWIDEHGDKDVYTVFALTLTHTHTCI